MTDSIPKDIPEDLDEATDLLSQVTLDVQEIQDQLGDRQRTNEEGDRLSPHDYQTWRKKANHALTLKLNQLRKLKSWIKKKRRDDKSPSVQEAIEHLENVCDTVTSLEAFDIVEQKELFDGKIDAAKDFLRRAKSNNLTKEKPCDQ